ncbi:MAG: AMP-binding protein [Candidatus Saccharibacteria bacterium]|nr:AMP-binding protein [Candidatus Saccharibacteria bacterium]
MNLPYEQVPVFTNFANLVDYCASNYGTKCAFKTKDISMSYIEFRDKVAAVAKVIAKTYTNRRIALIGENSLDWLIVYFAIVLSNNTVIIIDREETPEHMKEMLKTADADTIFASKKHIEKIEELKATKGFIFKKPIETHEFSEILDVKPEKIKLVSTNPDDAHIIFFTSGTSGPSKAVELTERSVLYDLYSAASLYRPYGSVVAFLPFHHAFGLVTAVMKPYYYGAPVYISGSLKSVAKDIKTHSPQTVFAVPAVVELFYRQIWREARKSKQELKLKLALKASKLIPTPIAKFYMEGTDGTGRNILDSKPVKFRRKLFKSIHASFGNKLEVIICGGAYLDQKYIDFFEAIGIYILNGYGITECSPVVAVNRTAMRKRGSVGQIGRGIEIKIASDDEILIKSPIVMKGYHGNGRETRKALDKGYLHTGDLGYIDEDNYLFITGRKKDLIILSNGENISPESIEKDFLHEKSVRECIVSVEEGQLIAEIFPTEDYLKDQDFFDKMLYNYNKGRARNKQVALIRLRDEEFPKNNNTKILRRNLK